MKTVTETIIMLTSEKEIEFAKFWQIPIISLHDVTWVIAEDYKYIKEELRMERVEEAEFWSQMM